MRPIVAIIDRVLEHRGKKTISGMERSSKNPREENQKLLMQILVANKDTEYGRKCGFGEIRFIEEYREKVPYSDYDTYAPYIERMVKYNEENLITAYKVIQYAETSGSVGVQKKIPVTDKSMKIYEKYSFSRSKYLAAEYYRKNYGRSIPAEKGLVMLETETTVMEDGTPRGSVSGAAARQFRRLFPFILTSPDPILFPAGGMNMNYMKARFALEDPKLVFILGAFMTNIVDMMNYIRRNWEMIVEDIENGTVNKDVCERASISISRKNLIASDHAFIMELGEFLPGQFFRAAAT